MNRFDSMEEDSHRLPEGFVRIGYDADSQRYQYRDESDGSYWEGPEGELYGDLTRGLLAPPNLRDLCLMAENSRTSFTASSRFYEQISRFQKGVRPIAKNACFATLTSANELRCNSR